MNIVLEKVFFPSLLPAGYTRLAYLESLGAGRGLAYMDTGVSANQDFSAKAVFTMNMANDNFLFGARTSADAADKFCCAPYSSLIYCQFGSYLGSARVPVEMYVKHTFEMSKNGAFLDGEMIYEYGEVENFTTPYTVRLWSIANATGDTRSFIGRTYTFQLWEKGIPIRDFIPAVDTAGTLCMYDKVTKQAYYFVLQNGRVGAGVETLSQLYSLLAKLPDKTGQATGVLTIRLDAALQTDELRALIDAQAEAKNWEITEAA